METAILAVMVVVLSLPSGLAAPFNFKTLLSKTMTPCFANRPEINCVDEDPSIVEPDWMARLSDDLSLSQIAIPGTHQSAALYGGSLGQCQVWNVAEQLQAGIRFIDIRIKLAPAEMATVNGTTKNGVASAKSAANRVLLVFHGPLYQFVTLEDVLKDVRRFLEDHPTEAVLLLLNEEIYTKGRRGQPDFTRELTQLLQKNADILWCCDHVPNLRDIRGTIVIIRQYGTRPAYGMSIDAFWTQNFWNIPTMWHLETKKGKFKRLMNLADSFDSWHEPVINYASANGWAAHPYMIASKMNKFVLDLLEKECSARRVGIIPMDFPGYGIVHRIIDVNFCNQSSNKKPKNYGRCRSQWQMGSFRCKVTQDSCSSGHTATQAWRGWTCMCSCANTIDSDDKGCATVREKWCE